MTKTIFTAGLALMLVTVTTSAEAQSRGHYKKKGHSGYTYRNGSYYDASGRYIGQRNPARVKHHRKMYRKGQARYSDRFYNNGSRKSHPVHGPGWVPPGQRKKMQRSYYR